MNLQLIELNPERKTKKVVKETKLTMYAPKNKNRFTFNKPLTKECSFTDWTGVVAFKDPDSIKQSTDKGLYYLQIVNEQDYVRTPITGNSGRLGFTSSILRSLFTDDMSSLKLELTPVEDMDKPTYLLTQINED